MTRRSAPLVFLLLLAFAAAWSGINRKSAPVQPLSPSTSLIVLLTPGLSLRELIRLPAVQQQQRKGAALLGVMPTRLGAGPSPPTLEEACRSLSRGSRSPEARNHSLKDSLQDAAGLNVFALDAAAAVLVGGIPPSREAARLQLPDGPEGGATDTELLAASINQRLQTEATKRSLIAATFADLSRADESAPLALPPASQKQREASLRRLDDLLRRLMKMPPRSDNVALLLVTPLPSASAAARRERLGPVLLWHRGNKGSSGLLTSPATRQTPGLIAASDVAATIAALAGLPEQSQRIGAGRAAVRLASPLPPTYLPARVDDWAFQSRTQQGLVGVPWFLAGAILLGAWLREKRWGPSLLVGASAIPLALVVAPVLVPARPGFEPVIYIVAALIAALLGVIAAAAAALPRSASLRIFTAVCAGTMLVLIGDTLWGGPLLARSPFSYSVIEAARFYGIGNDVSGVLLGAATVSLLLWGVSLPAITLLAGCLVLVYALPMLGADAGGVAAVLAAFGALFLGRIPPRQRSRMVFATLLLIAVLFTGYALWEGGRGAQDRTHVGEAVAAARTRGIGALTEIAARKVGVNARLLFTSPWAVLLLSEGSILFFFRRRISLLPADERLLLQGLFVAGGALFLLNDSGVVAAAACLLAAPPLLLLAETNDPPR